MKKVAYSLIVIFLSIPLLFLVFLFIGIMTFLLQHNSENFGQFKGQSIAVVQVKGILYDSRRIIEDIHKAYDNEQIKGVILRIDSPGGSTSPAQEIYQEVLRLGQKKLVYASFGQIATSAGYYIGMGASKVYASSGTLTGSIGVIMHLVNASGLIDALKIDPQIIKAGKYKDIGGIFRQLSEGEKKLLQGVVTDIHVQFKDDVVTRRKKLLTKDINEIAQGQVFSGSQALKIGLVDQLGGLWKAARDMNEALGNEGEPKLYYIEGKNSLNLQGLLSGVGETLSALKGEAMLGNSPQLY